MSSWAKKKPQLNKQTNKQKQNEIQHQEKCLFTQLFRPIKLVCIKPGKRPVILEMISCWSFVMHGLTKPFIKKKGQNTTKKNHKAVKIVKLLIKKIISIFFRSTRIIRSISDSLFELIWYEPDNPCLVKKNTNN